MLSRKRPRVSSATGTWKPRKKARVINRAVGSSGLRTGGWRGVPGRRGELKYVDVDQQNNFAETGVGILLNGLAPGTGASQRIGKKVTLKSVQLRLSIVAGTAGVAPFAGMVRCFLIYDKQANATTPTVAQILEKVAGSSPMNMDNRDRFLVIYDRQFALDQAGGNQSSQLKMYKRLNLTTVFNAGTAGTVADITSGSLYIVFIGENGYTANPTNPPFATWYSRIRYEDA